MEYHNIGEQDIIYCKMHCGEVAVDLHHIVFRSRGGSDNVDNLIPLCRHHHNLVHASKITKEELLKKYDQRKRKRNSKSSN